MSLGNIGSRTASSFSSEDYLPSDDSQSPHPNPELNLSLNDTESHLSDSAPTSLLKAATKVDPEKTLSATLQAASAVGDDRNLASHGDNRKYWYSIGDGYRLLLAIRKNTLIYANKAVGGEEYSAHRENDQRILITDPYYLDNFAIYLADDIKRIMGSHDIPALNRPWTQPPRIIIIPVLTGCHWRCVRVELNYADKKIHILFDDPYGKHRFDETMKATIKNTLIQQVNPLFGTIGIKIEERLPPIAYEEQDKEINQQGAGNGYDCGPIVFGNITDYADIDKNNQTFSQGQGLRITASGDVAHEELMIGVRTTHMRDYAEMSGVSIDEARLANIKKLMHAGYQAKLAVMQASHKIDQTLHSHIACLSSEQISVLFNAMEEMGLTIQEAFDSVKAEYNFEPFKPYSASVSLPSFPHQALVDPHVSASFPGGLTAHSAGQKESRAEKYPDHIDLTGQNLSLAEMQQRLEEVQNNKRIGHITWGTISGGEKAQKLRDQIELQIIQNNQAYRRYPTDFIYGVLSKHVYENAKAGDAVIFEDKELQVYNQYVTQWIIHCVHDRPELGKYYGAVYENKQTRQLVLAHRGTPPSPTLLLQGESALKEDMDGVAAGKIVNQHYAAYQITKEAAEYAKEQHYHFSITGHSLGAWLAEISVYFSEFAFDISAKAVTFDSPGSITMNIFNPNIVNHENKRNIKDLDITTYLSDPNIINSCNQHVGRVYRLYPEYDKPGISRWIDASLGRLVNLEGFWSIIGHALLPLLETFDPISGKPRRVDLMSRWPAMEYTPRDTLSGAVSNIIGAIAPQQTLINNVVTWGSRYIIDQVVYRTTIGSVINRLFDGVSAIAENRADMSQYVKYWKLLRKPHISPEEAFWLKDTFSLSYEGSYEVIPDTHLIRQLISRYKGGADWYLKKLHDCSAEKIIQHLGQSSLITQQLITLKEQYRLELHQGHYRLIANSTPIDAIKEHLLRLIDITGGKDGTIAQLLQKHQQKSLSHTLKLTTYLPASLGSRYIVRDEYIAQIEKRLLVNPYVIISGAPGFGKTTMAIEYGHQQKVHRTVIKIDADNAEKLASEYKRIAVELGIGEQQDPNMVIRLVSSKISSNPYQKVLLIFDNVENYTSIAPYLERLPVETKALVTTRHHRLKEGEPTIHLKPFTHSEAKQYIENSVIKDRISKGAQEVQALITHYAKGTDNVAPYYLNRAIALLAANPLMDIADYLKHIQNHPDDEGEIILQKRLMEKSKLAWPMLQYAAFLDPDAIDLQIFTQLFNVDKSDLNEAIKVLESLSAMYVVRKEGQAFLALHRLTQGIVEKFIENTKAQANVMSKTAILSKLAKNLYALYPTEDDNPAQEWQQTKMLMPHIESVLKRLPEQLPVGMDESLVAELLNNSGIYARDLGLHQKALTYHQKVLSLWQQCYPNKPSSEVANALNEVSSAYYNLGGEENISKGLALQERSLDMWQALHKNQPHDDVAISLNNLGMSYARLGGIENKRKGLSLQEQCLAMLQILYGDQPNPALASSLHLVGDAYINLGGVENTEKGLGLQRQALAMRQALYPDQPHPEIATLLNNVGIAYQNLGGVDNRQKGFVLQEQALAMRQALYPDQPHPNIAASLNNVGNCYYELGGIDNIRKGLALQEQALAMLQTLYDNQPHPEIATSLHNVGSNYKALGHVDNIRKGLALQEQALAMLQTLYDNQPYPEIATSLNDLGSSYYHLGGVENVRKGLIFLEKALAMLQTLYGDQPHLEIANSLNNAGGVYQSLGGAGNIRKGLAFYEQALAMRQTLCGDQPNPAVANSLNNVGASYCKLGSVDNIRKGLIFCEQALAMWKTLYGDQPRPDIATCLDNVGVGYKALEGLDNSRKGLVFREEALAMWQTLYGDQPHPETALSLNNVGNGYYHLGGVNNIRKGLVFQEQALTMRQTLYGDQPHADIATSLNNVGIAYENLGGVENRQKGLALQEPALAMLQALYPDQPHPDIATSLNNVGNAYENLGGVENRQKGLALKEQALAMRKILHGHQPHAELAQSLNNIGIAYDNLGGIENRQKGLALQEQALAMRRTLYSDQPHPKLAHSLNNVGIAYVDLGGVENSKKGLILQEQALVMRQALYPDQPHPELANSLNNVGIAYAGLGGVENRQKGLVLQEQALTMRQKIYLNQLHLDMANSLNNVGMEYEALGGIENRQKGLALKEQALTIRQALYPDQPHLHVAHSLNHVGVSYESLGGVDNRKKGLILKEQALVMLQILYSDQPNVYLAMVLASLGMSYANLGSADNEAKGLTLLEKALAMRQALYGNQAHPAIAYSLNNLGCFYAALRGVENNRKGLALKEQALAMRQVLCELPHPELALSLNSVGCAYVNLGEIEKGFALLQQALTMRQTLYAEPHAEIAQSLRNVALSYKKLPGEENKKTGLALQQQAWTMWKMLYPNLSAADITNLPINFGSVVEGH